MKARKAHAKNGNMKGNGHESETRYFSEENIVDYVISKLEHHLERDSYRQEAIP